MEPVDISVFIENMGNLKYETIYFLELKSKKGFSWSVYTWAMCPKYTVS